MMMTCPRCFATYDVPENALRRPAQRVRCSACGFAWDETPPPREAIAGFAPPESPAAHNAPTPAHNAPRDERPPQTAAPRAKKSEHKPSPVSRKPSALLPVLGWTGLAIASVLVLTGVFREPLGHQIPALADAYEAIGLPVETPQDWFRFTLDQPVRSEQGDKTVLALSGQLTNQSRRTRDVPPVRIFWRGTNGQDGPSVTVTPHPASLKVGESATFQGELVGVDARAGGEIKVTFAEEATPPTPPAPPAPTTAPGAHE